jgi:predicted DNA-binding protein with PD1-like motif/ribosomal protein S18 acetylase RimI-like enzyme
MSNMHPLPLRLQPGTDLRRALEATISQHGGSAAFVLAGVGSLRQARLRLAAREQPDALDGNLEILTLAGTVSRDGAHLHASVADEHGRVIGGHVSYGCVVRTTAEVLVVLLPGWSFTREVDLGTGFAELVVRSEPTPADRDGPRAAEPGAAPHHSSQSLPGEGPVAAVGEPGAFDGAMAEPGRCDLELRVLGPDDVAFMESMLALFGRAFDDPDTYDRSRPGPGYLAGLLGSPGFVAVAAIQDGEVVGGLAAYVLPKFEQARSEIYIYDLAVDESFRRRGIATSLINKLRSVAAERGACVIFVQAESDNAPAIELYSKLGAREDVLHFDIEPLRDAGDRTEPGSAPGTGRT